MKIQPFLYAFTAVSLIHGAIAEELPATRNPNKAGDGVQVGISKHDGITVTGDEAFITRNGATEKLAKDLILSSGMTVRPDGTLILRDGTESKLRADQILTLDGMVMQVQADPNTNPAPPPAATGGQNARVSGAAMPAGNASGQNRNNRRDQNGGGGSVEVSGTGTGLDGTTGVNGVANQNVRNFVSRDGTQFPGVINQDGSITTTDGRSIVNDGTVRTVTTDANGQATFGTVARNGTITQSDGTVIAPDGTTRTSDGRVFGPGQVPGVGKARGVTDTPPPNNPSTGQAPVIATPADANAHGTVTNPPNGQPYRTPGDANANGTVTNSPNNTGTVNNPNGNPVTGRPSNPNVGSTVNNPAGNPVTGQPAAGAPAQGTVNGQVAPGQTNDAGGSRTGGSRPVGKPRNGGSAGGGGVGTGTSGAGGASGGGGGGASR